MIKLKNLLNESFGMGELPSSKLMKMKVPAKQMLKEKGEISGLLNRLDKNKPLKVGDITTIKSGKYAGKKVKIVADLGGGSYGLEFVR